MQIGYDLIQWPNVVLEKREPFLSEVLDQGKMMNILEGHFRFIEKVF